MPGKDSVPLVALVLLAFAVSYIGMLLLTGGEGHSSYGGARRSLKGEAHARRKSFADIPLRLQRPGIHVNGRAVPSLDRRTSDVACPVSLGVV